MTARDTYRDPVDSFEAIAELRRGAGTQFDPGLVELFIEHLSGKELAYRHGDDADFEAELSLDRRIHDYVAATAQPGRSVIAMLHGAKPGKHHESGVTEDS
jgi:hypothetical protein